MAAAVETSFASDGAMVASVRGEPDQYALGPNSIKENGSSSCHNKAISPATKLLTRHSKDETLLRVTIVCSSSGGGSKFFVPVSLLVDRELEMRKSAKAFGIGPTRWTTSRLFREWQEQVNQDVSSNVTTPTTSINIVLHPEKDCAAANQSHSFTWQPWLTTSIRAYYNTGTIRIPDDCIGSDILLALEYFGILYSPDQLVFDSFGGYLRVKMWSDYFTHRAKLADWVVQRLLTSTPSRHSHSFVTSPQEEEELLYLNKPITILDGDLLLDPVRYGDTSSRAVVHEFFNNEGNEQDGDKLDGLMRDDFCSFVQACLPGTIVSFTIRRVTTSTTKETVQRAVLRVNLTATSPVTAPKVWVSSSEFDNDVVVPKPTRGLNGSPVYSTPTASTQPVTPSTLGDFGSVDPPRRSIFLRRSKTERVRRTLNHSFEQGPEDEYISPEQHAFSPPQQQSPASPWSRYDEASVDQPRETLGYSKAFVRSLSEKIIRQTLRDMDEPDEWGGGHQAMDTIDHGLTSHWTRPASNSPSDEGGALELARKSWNNVQNEDVKRRLLPTLDLEKEYDRTGHHEDKAIAKDLQMPQLDVIDGGHKHDVTDFAPIRHVSVTRDKPCDSSVMSALSNPFEDTKQGTPMEALPIIRQPSLTSLSDFRTTVDALSAIGDEHSVKIGVPEETNFRPPQKLKFRKVHEESDDEDDIQPGCVDALYATFCGPPDGTTKKKKSKYRVSKKSDEDTPGTEEETDDDDSRYLRLEPHRSNKGESLTGTEAVSALGDLADSVVENVCPFGDARAAKQEKRMAMRRGRSPKRRNTTYGDDWTASTRGYDDDDDDRVDDVLSRISVKSPQTGVTGSTTARQDLPPRPISHGSQAAVKISVCQKGKKHGAPALSSAARTDSLQQLQEMLRSSGSTPSTTKRISHNVMRNLELLKSADMVDMGDFGEVGRISRIRPSRNDPVIYRTGAKPKADHGQDKARRGGRKGWLGFLRPKK